jgi:hypothetical protein
LDGDERRHTATLHSAPSAASAQTHAKKMTSHSGTVCTGSHVDSSACQGVRRAGAQKVRRRTTPAPGSATAAPVPHDWLTVWMLHRRPFQQLLQEH